jgi:predicted nucleic acid-binding protein
VSATTFIDTLFVVALINQRDQYHGRAAELAASHDGQQFLITDAVLLEIGNALARKYRQEAAEVVEDFLCSGDVEVVSCAVPGGFEVAHFLIPTRPCAGGYRFGD